MDSVRSNGYNLQKSTSSAAPAPQPAGITYSGSNIKIVKSDIAPTGESIQLVRPLAESSKSTEQIVGELVNKYDYKKSQSVRASDTDLTNIQRAFGKNLTSELLSTYDGSAIISDTQQDLIGEKYLAEQIKKMQEKKVSVIDRYAHLLYEGEKDYKPSPSIAQIYQSSSNANLRPIQQQEFTLSHSKLTPTASSKQLAGQSSGVLAAAASNGSSARLQQQQQEQQRQAQQQEQLRIQQQIQEQLRRQEAQKGQQDTLKLQEQLRAQQEQLRQQQLQNEQLKQQYQDQLRLQQQKTAAEAQARAAAEAQVRAAQMKSSSSSSTSSQRHQQQQGGGQSQQLPQLNSNNLQSVQLDAYNDPQFKALLEQITKPFNVPLETVELDAQWPSAEKIAQIAEPIIIPAPDPIVIPAPNVLKSDSQGYPEAAYKTEVTYYPNSNSYTDFQLRQLNLNN